MYGLQFLGEFDSLAGVRCRLEILGLNYSGSVTKLTMGGDPISHQYSASELFEPIKGSVLKIQLVDISIESFISDSDLNFKVIFYEGGQVKFIGYLMQDDYTEDVVEFRHAIELTATDALGSLKNVLLSDNLIFTPTGKSPHVLITFYDSNTLIIPSVFGVEYAKAGNQIMLHNYDSPVGEIDGSYTIKEVGVGLTDITLTLVEPVPISSFIYEVDYSFNIHKNLQQVLPISEFLTMCLSVTRLELPILSFSTLKDEGKNNIYESLIDGRAFLKDDTSFKDCDEVIQMILKTIRMSLFQEDGKWTFIRWGEYPNFSAYSYDWGFLNETSVSDVSIKNVDFIMGVVKSIVRPARQVIDTFNFEQQKNIIRDFDLLETGRLLSKRGQTVDGEIQHVFEYDAIHWQRYSGSELLTNMRTIVVIFDDYGNEIDRYLKVLKPGIGTVSALFNKGDTFTLSFKFSTTRPGSNAKSTGYGLLLDGGSGKRYSLSNGFHAGDSNINTIGEVNWESVSYAPPTLFGLGKIFYNWTSTMNPDNEVSFDINTEKTLLPNDGKFYFTIITSPTSGEDQYRDFKIDYNFRVSRSTKIIGQHHKQSRNINLLNILEQDIKVDMAPKFQIAGVIYSDTETLAVRFKTSRDSGNLGDIITSEILSIYSKPRLELEGEFIGNFGMVNFIEYDGKNLVPIYLEKNYKEGKINAKFTEIRNTNSTLESTYKLEYIYESKR